MMAKMFYTLEETKAALGKNEEEIKQLAREGRLREFRDGPRLMFKADQVESIKNELGLGGAGAHDSGIGISDTGAPIGLVDSRSASASGISLADTDAKSGGSAGLSLGGSIGGSMSGIPLTSSGTGMPPLKDDTALAADLGLSGSMGGVPSPGSRTGLSGGSMAGGSGVNVITPGDTGEHVDPSAQTNIASNVPDQVNLEGVGSGSGLLDLTRESDDTSLGAELLDEIAPGGSKGGSSRGVGGSAVSTGTRAGTAIAEPAISGGPVRSRGGAAVMQIEQTDPMAPAFAGAALGAAIFVLVAAMVLCSAILGTTLPLVQKIHDNHMSFGMLAGIGAAPAVLFFIIGLIIGKSK
jgi:hypothetical protein